MYRRVKRKTKLINLFLFILIAIVFIGCLRVSPVSKGEISKESSEIVILAGIPETIMSTNKGVDLSNLEVSLFEGLVEITDNNKIGPALCKGWKVSDDGIEYEFLLRDNIKWSNGEEITSQDFKDFFKVLFSKDNLNFNCKEMYSIYGVEEYKAGVKEFSDVAIENPSKNILKIRLNEKDDNFLKKLTKPEYRLRKLHEALDNYKLEFNSLSYTGAYIIEKIDSDGSILLTENKNYNREKENKTKIRLLQGKSDEENMASYALGKIDILKNPSITAFKEGNLQSNVEKYKNENILFMVMNTKKGLTEYVDFRKGISSALSYNLINSYIIENGLGLLDFKEVNVENIESSIDLESNNILEYNEDTSKKKEEEAKSFFSTIPEGIKKEIKIIAIDNFENQMITEFIKDELSKYDIKTNIKLLIEEELGKEVENENFNLYIDSTGLGKEEVRKYTERFKNIYEEDSSMFSLYRKYDIWCKSNKIKKLYIDTNGNIIFKYTGV